MENHDFSVDGFYRTSRPGFGRFSENGGPRNAGSDGWSLGKEFTLPFLESGSILLTIAGILYLN